MGTVISYTSKLLQQRCKICLSTLIYLLPQFGRAFSLLKKGVLQYFSPYNECTSHWCLVIHFHVRIEQGPVQTVAIKLETHNSLEYHNMLKH